MPRWYILSGDLLPALYKIPWMPDKRVPEMQCGSVSGRVHRLQSGEYSGVHGVLSGVYGEHGGLVMCNDFECA